MKNIIFMVIDKMLLSNSECLCFDHDVISNLVESINLYGMSINKFKRMLRMILSDFFRTCEHFYIHNEKLSLKKEEDFNGAKQDALL